MRASETPATVTAARTGQIHPAALASRRVVTGKAASTLLLKGNTDFFKPSQKKVMMKITKILPF